MNVSPDRNYYFKIDTSMGLDKDYGTIFITARLVEETNKIESAFMFGDKEKSDVELNGLRVFSIDSTDDFVKDIVNIYNDIIPDTYKPDQLRNIILAGNKSLDITAVKKV